MSKQARLPLLFLVFFVVYLSNAQYVPPEALVEPLKPAGIRISIPGEFIIQMTNTKVNLNF